MNIYNTLTRKIEEFKPLSDVVGIYICGPTVYDYAHIGHARTYVNFDVLVRVLKFLDFKIKVVMNITDVGHLTSDADEGEDKLAKKAVQEKKTAWAVAKFYENDFWQMEKSLNIQRPDVVCKATDYIQEMIEWIKRLEEKGYTYKTSDGIYFDTSKFENYGKMARLDIKGLKEGARVEKNQEKKNATDFALWKFSPSTSSGSSMRDMEWQSPWGLGFPGWHIECSSMSIKHLGESFDIHTGGVDHIPVHHTNEIAQSEAVTGKPFVKYWLHANHLMVESEKMSKSLNNFLRVKDIEDKGFDPLALRYLFLTGHYRTKTNFTWKGIEGAQAALKRLKLQITNYKLQKERTSLSEEKLEKVKKFQEEFKAALENDLDMPSAVAVVWKVIKSNIPPEDKWDLIRSWDEVLGLDLTQITNYKLQITKEVKKLVKEREELRGLKKWDEADEIRKRIEKLGYRVEDTDKGSSLINLLKTG